MLVKTIEQLVEMLISNKKCDFEDRDIIVHGITASISIGINIVTAVLLGILYDMIIESFIFLVSFSFIRTYAGGYHCKNPISCYFLSNGVVAVVLLTLKVTGIEYVQQISIWLLVISIPVLLKLSPVDTPTRLLDTKEREYFRKQTLRYLLYELLCVIVLLFMRYERFAYIVCLGIFVSAILVLLGECVNKRKKSTLKN